MMLLFYALLNLFVRICDCFVYYANVIWTAFNNAFHLAVRFINSQFALVLNLTILYTVMDNDVLLFVFVQSCTMLITERQLRNVRPISVIVIVNVAIHHMCHDTDTLS